MKVIGAPFAIIWIGLSLPSVAAPLLPSGAFVYSNACASSGGDFEGFRVRFTRGPADGHVTVEFNDDGSDGRSIARNVEFNPTSGALSFSFHGNNGNQHSFHGTASLEKLVGTFDADLTVTLPRIKATPKYLADCDPDQPA